MLLDEEHIYDGFEQAPRRNVYTYDKKTKKTYTLYFKSIDDWKPLTRESYEYDSNANIKYTLYEEYRNDKWREMNRHTSKYDSTGKLIYNLHERKDSVWRNFIKYEALYDLILRQVNKINYLWEKEQWVYRLKETESYDESNKLIEINNYFWNENKWEHSQKYYSLPETSDVFGYRFIYTYMKGTPAEDLLPPEDINLYPNPASALLIIKSSALKGIPSCAEISSVNGSLIKSFNLDGLSPITIDIIDIPNGAYFLSLYYGDTVSTKKFVISR